MNETLRIYAGLGFIKLCMLGLVIAVLLTGCAPGNVDPGKLAPPPKSLMTPPAKFPTLKPGDDAALKLAEAAEAHNRNVRKVRGLQGYIKTTRKE